MKTLRLGQGELSWQSASHRSPRICSRKSPCKLIVAVLPLFIVGCLPQKPPLDGHLEFKKANQTLFGMHAAHGAIYKSEHQVNGKPFTANWELANYLKKAAMVQLKPPSDTFDRADLYMALHTILHDEENSPWHPVIADSVLDCFASAAQMEDDETGWGSAICPDGPYEITLKLKINGAEWFCEVRVQNQFDPEKLAEAEQAAEDALDRLEAQHADD